MPVAGIKVLFVGKSWDVPYEVEVCDRIHGLFSQIATFRPDVLITSESIPGSLNLADFELRKRWIHVDPESSVEDLCNTVENCYASNIWGVHQNQKTQPLVSVYTGTYNTGDYLRECYQSLKDQTYTNWEWSVVDDGSTDGTWESLLELSREDHRVNPTQILHTGKIGNTKDVATRLANGVYLVELDHDDMLVDTALDEVRKAFDADPEIGMVYTNCACFFSDGKPQRYNDDFWKDRYREVEYRGKTYLEALNPNIYDRFGDNYWDQFGWFLTVGPNHIRAYRADKLRELGGYNRHLPVADDWDVYARFFLHSKCHHIEKMLYLYRFHDAWQNTTFTRNQSIQDHLELGRRRYALEFENVNTQRLGKSVGTDRKGLSVVILDWNTRDMTERCVSSVKASNPSAEIVLVQNGFHFDCPEADKVIQAEMNTGFAGGCNWGALESSGDFICFLNSDTVVEGDVLDRLVKEVRNDAVGIVAPYSDKARPPQGYISKETETETQDCESVVGFCAVMRKDLFFEVGGFDTRFCNFEDNDLCRRIRNRGLLCRIVGGTWVHHEENASFKKNGVNVEKEIRNSEKIFNVKWPKIRVIALTYNEMDALPDFVTQFSGITDDICILDSGSTDGTVEWATENGLQVRTREFDQFDTQRNAALDLFSEGSDWVVMFDPDERLDQNTLDNFYEMVRAPEYDIYLAPLWARDRNGSEKEWVAKPFLFRSSESIRWVFPVHEKLIGSTRQALVTNGKIIHLVAAHTQERRAEMHGFYQGLEKRRVGVEELSREYPILGYETPDDDRIKKIYLGPLVSVIIPTYNRPELLGRAIDSVLDQDYLAKEILVIGDNTDDLPPEFPRVRAWNLPKNHGEGGAVPRNYGLIFSAGRWIAYLDDDNLLKSNHLSSIFNSVVQKNSRFGLSSMEVEGKTLLCSEPKFGSVDTSCILHEKNLVNEFGWWRDHKAAGYAHDWELVRPWTEADVSWIVTELPTVIYNKETCRQKEFLDRLITE